MFNGDNKVHYRLAVSALTCTPSRVLGSRFEVCAVGEDQAAVIELDRPSATGLSDLGRPDDDGLAGRVTEVLNDHPEAGAIAVGVRRHTLPNFEIRTLHHGPSVNLNRTCIFNNGAEDHKRDRTVIPSTPGKREFATRPPGGPR